MARLVITDVPEFSTRIQSAWRSAGLTESFASQDSGVSTQVALKRSLDHRNALRLGGDDWIVGTGTYLTESGRMGADALRDTSGLASSEAQQDALIGHYAIAQRQGRTIRAFCDPIDTHDLFFIRTESGFAVATFLADLLYLPQINRNVRDIRALSAAFHGEQGIASRPVIDGVRRIKGHEEVEIRLDNRTGSVHILARKPWRAGIRTDSRSLDLYLEENVRVFRAIRQAGPVAVNATGGLDSRLLMASARRHKLDTSLLYGVGNSRMTNTRPEDLAAARRIAKAFDWPLEILDWSQNEPYTDDQRRALHGRFGFKQPYGGTKGVFSSVSGPSAGRPPMQLAGYNSGFTNNRPWEWDAEALTLDAVARRFAKAYLDVLAEGDAQADYLADLRRDFEELAADRGISTDERLAVADASLLLVEAAKAKNTYNINAFNQFSYFLAPFKTTRLYRLLLETPAEERQGDRFQIEAIERLAPEALDLPVFSGVRRFTLDRESRTMKAEMPSLAQRIADGIRVRSGLTGQTGPRAHARTERFRAELRQALNRLPEAPAVDHDRLVRKDPRAVYRYLTSREIGQL